MVKSVLTLIIDRWACNIQSMPQWFMEYKCARILQFKSKEDKEAGNHKDNLSAKAIAKH